MSLSLFGYAWTCVVINLGKKKEKKKGYCCLLTIYFHSKVNMKKKKELTLFITLSHVYTAVPVTLNIKAHLFHALLVSLNLIFALVRTILHYTGIPHSLGVRTGTACLAFWLLLLSFWLLAGSVLRHTDMMLD